MRWSVRLFCAVVAMLTACVLLSAGQPASASTASQLPEACFHQNVLCAGQKLVAAPKHRAFTDLVSNDGRFTLSLYYAGINLSEDERLPDGGRGGTLWERATTSTSPGHPHSTLTLQKNGDLVFRLGNGHKVWASNTAGSGHHNRVVLRNDGNLVMRTGSGKRVWSSHTTAIFLVRGQQLGSGQSLVNRSGVQWSPPATTLTMSTGGDLVLARGATRTWHSDTHVKGSILRMRKNGRLVVVTPGHRVVWRSPAFGRNTVMSLAHDGRFTLDDLHTCWQRPSDSSVPCDQT